MVKSIILLYILCTSGIIAASSTASAQAQRCAFDEFIVSAVGTAVTQTLQELSDSVQDLTQVIHGLRKEIKDLKKATKPDLDIKPNAETTPKPETQQPICGQSSGYEFSSDTGSSYKLHLVTASWESANETCGSEGAGLAVVNSPKEAALLAGMLEKSHLMYASLGVFLDTAGNTWKTVTGETLRLAGYEAWGDEEPWEGDAWLYGTLGSDTRLYTGNRVPRPFICEKTPEVHVNRL